MRGDGVGEVIGDCAEDLGLDDAIHARPVRIGGDRLVEEDVLLKRELPNSEEELVAPTGVVAGGDSMRSDSRCSEQPQPACGGSRWRRPREAAGHGANQMGCRHRWHPP